MDTDLPFDNLYRHGFARVAVCLPILRLADPTHNGEQVLSLARQASSRGASLAVFPELTLSGYSCDDLFHQQSLVDACSSELDAIVDASRDLLPVLALGLPLEIDGLLFNCAVAIHRGRLLAVVPKSFLPTYREYYEKRYFAAATAARSRTFRYRNEDIPFGTDVVVTCQDVPGLRVHLEICEDLWVPTPPSTQAALAGATVLCNLSASNVTIAKAEYRRLLCAAQSGRCVAAYLYSGAGYGESTTDVAWDGHGMIYENAELLEESQRFSKSEQLLLADLDLDRLKQERVRLSSFNDSVERSRETMRSFRTVPMRVGPPQEELPLSRSVQRFPYVPADVRERDERCEEAYRIQVHGLTQRLEATGINKVVIGVSGGLDSSQALLVTVKAMEALGKPREHVLAYTLPGFATSERTYTNAKALMSALGVSSGEIDIRPSCEQMLRDLDHPFARGEPVHDVTFENVQAGERTSHLFRLANHHGALVVGTGDLSELALGWATYGVGDQMSHYNVNVSVPKTLVQHLLRWIVGTGAYGAEVSRVLQSILETEISPELVPDDQEGDASLPSQSTEAVIGPYELQDFHLYYTSRYGFVPSKVAFLCHHAWGAIERGPWPETLPPSARHSYSLSEIKHWLAVFLERFFTTSQFKRSALPNGPKVGSGGSLSPRGDWRAPSDATAKTWLAELHRNVPG